PWGGPSFLTFLIFLTRMNADSRGSFSVCGLRSWRSWGSPALVVARFLAACWLGGWRRWISWPFAGVCGVAVWCLRCGRESRCRWRVGPSAFAGATSVEAVWGALVRDAVNPSMGAFRRHPCRRNPADAPPHHLLEPLPARRPRARHATFRDRRPRLSWWWGRAAALGMRRASPAPAVFGPKLRRSPVLRWQPTLRCSRLRAAAPRWPQRGSVMLGSEATQPPGLFAAAQQTRPGGPSDRRCDGAS